jgi:hypothetical protein
VLPLICPLATNRLRFEGNCTESLFKLEQRLSDQIVGDGISIIEPERQRIS